MREQDCVLGVTHCKGISPVFVLYEAIELKVA